VAVLCRDVLTLCDGYGCSLLDNCAWCCTLARGHEGPHRDEFEHEGKSVIIAWHSEPFRVAVTKED
jgi:hypothetical protein